MGLNFDVFYLVSSKFLAMPNHRELKLDGAVGDFAEPL